MITTRHAVAPSGIGRRYNWRPDLPDRRDHKFKYALTEHGTPPPMPPLVDLRPQCPPVVDQGQIGSCTANALAGALGYLELADAVAKADPAVDFDVAGFSAFSRLFIYWNERVAEGDQNEDGGAQIRDGVSSLNQIGCCSEVEWQYDPANLFVAPPPGCVSDAAPHRISEYVSLDGTDINALKSCLVAGFPFVFGFTVYQSFESNAVAASGEVPMPGASEQSLGGHAVMCVGYDDSKSALIVRNSWGTGWGDGGCFYLPYAYATNADLADDFWTLRK